MLTTEQINTIHRLHFAEHWSIRKIARHLHLGRRTIAQYLAKPARTAAPRQRTSKLDPWSKMPKPVRWSSHNGSAGWASLAV
jgi:IS30 family transposase